MSDPAKCGGGSRKGHPQHRDLRRIRTPDVISASYDGENLPPRGALINLVVPKQASQDGFPLFSRP
ncbi:hypothetical protein [Nocardia miyunensis]|uniref:hypothetical protein n=1 Tax=Nocardia miyunensis TaxID=282684 RepID=UPI000829D733|nr:hypothetical protein [Nocardia miyunensis]